MTLRKVTSLYVYDGTELRLITGSSISGPSHVPGVPTGLDGSATDTEIDLTWTASSAPPNGTTVDYYEVTMNGTVVARPNGTAASVTGLTPATSYLFAVRAVSSAGVASDFSAPTSIVTTNVGSGVPGWTQVWEDTFDGSSVDASKWNIRNNTTQSNMDGRNMAYNVTVAGGVLSIHGKAESVGGQQWTCGYLDTIGKASWRPPFRAEARLRVPWGSDAYGFWPAFWFRPDDGGDGEIDVMEAWPNHSQISYTVWQNYSGGAHPQLTLPTSQVNDAWHTYTMEVTPTSIAFYYDGTLRWSPSFSTYPWMGTIFSRNTKWNIRHNLQIGGSWGGKPNGSTDFSQTYDTDYIRIWTK